MFGGTAAFTSLFISWALYGEAWFPSLPYWCATAAAATVGLVVNFVLNYLFNFRFRERTAFQQFWTFCAVSGFGIVLTSFLSESLLLLLQHNIGDNFHLGHVTLPPKFVANFVAVGLVVIYSFPAHRSLSFNVGIGARLRQLIVLLVIVIWRHAALKSTETYK
jgi:putative flippase GtrA